MQHTECQSLIFEDTNGGLLRPKPNEQPHFINKVETAQFFEALAKVTNEPGSLLTLPERYREVFSSLYPSSDNFHPKLRKWQPLPADYEFSGIDKAIFRLNKLFGIHSEFFDQYTYSEEERNGLICANKLGALIILNTGIEYAARGRYKPIADSVKDILNPEASIIMNPDAKYISGFHTKFASLVLLSHSQISEIKEPLSDTDYDQLQFMEGPGYDSYLRDDDYAILSRVSYYLGLRTYSTVPIEEAIRQPHISKVGLPKFTRAMVESGRVPIYDPHMDIMNQDIADPNFHNHPVLRGFNVVQISNGKVKV